MLQALRKLVGDPSDTTEVMLMVGNKSVDDILMKEELDELVRSAKGRLRVVHVIGTAADSAAPDGWSSGATYTLTLTLTLTLTPTLTPHPNPKPIPNQAPPTLRRRGG